eukprot:IDg2001t1
MLDERMHLLKGNLDVSVMYEKAEQYAKAVHDKCHALDNCVGFIDGTVIGIAWPNGNEIQRVAYNGHKRKHALKCQAVTSPDGLILHV